MTEVLAPPESHPPMVAALSPSSIATFKQCPRRFFYEKILRIETEPGLEAVCGSFVHLVLEHFMRLPPAERTPEAARRLATERWAEFVVDEESRFAELGLDEDTTRDFKRRAWTGISGYFSIEDPMTVDVVATEQEMEAELDGAPLFGIVDRLERWGERLVVSDYKTGKAPKWQDEIDEKLQQLRLYAAILDAQGTPVTTLRLLFLSPQLGAAAKAERCRVSAATAFAALTALVPDVAPATLGVAMDRVDAAQRSARSAAGPDDDRAEIARAAAVDEAWVVVNELGVPDAAQALLDAVATRRRAFFAQRDAERSRPQEILLEVEPEHITSARAEVAAIWEEATACYEAWDFPAHTGVLCDWCPFSDRCDAYAAMIASRSEASRPAA
ncbi:MAG: RecB family exonuclease [Acidimicrobiales bacterium]